VKSESLIGSTPLDPAPALTASVSVPSRRADFLTLTKPGLNSVVLFTTMATFVIGGGLDLAWTVLLHTAIGTALVAGGSAALNQYWERDTDAMMRRTRMRPLPAQRLHPQDALWFGVGLGAAGVAELSLGVNWLTAVMALITLASYVVVYTPLKMRSSLSTIVGAVPGALPAVIGWTAATNSLSVEAWVLFGIVFMWQMPHFLAIAWMCRDDYARAGIPLLPVIQPDGRSTGRQAVLYAAALVPMSFMPAVVGLGGARYVVNALVLGAILVVLSLEFATTRSNVAARRLFLGTILYLPLLWLSLIVATIW
jgi:protoheme IX farnesyltransferase